MAGQKAKRKGRLYSAASVLLFAALVINMGYYVSSRLSDVLINTAMFAVSLNMTGDLVLSAEKQFNSEIFADGEKASTVDNPATYTNNSEDNPPAESTAPDDVPAAPAGEPSSAVMPDIPIANQGTLIQSTYTAAAGGVYVQFGSGLIKNTTKLANSKLEAELAKPLEMRLKTTDQPQVLIVHTHATESFEPYDRPIFDTTDTWRNTDITQNMVAVGEALKDELAKAGIVAINDATLNDYPSYNGAYDRSAAVIKKYLQQYPTIQVVLDVHRDAIEPQEGTIVKPVATIGGKKAAQLMIISGCDDGTMNMPNWPSNFRFAAALQSAVEADYPTLTRPVLFCYRKYNQDLSKGALLLEFGSNANTLDEAKYSASLVGQAMGKLLNAIEN